MRLSALALAAALVPAAAVAQDAGPLVRVVDGDTYDVLLEGVSTRVRLDRADTPETGSRARCRREARLGAEAADWVRAEVVRREVAVFPIGRRDHYRREIVRVTIDGVDLADLLRWNGLAEAYPLGYRPDWCGERKSPAGRAL